MRHVFRSLVVLAVATPLSAQQPDAPAVRMAASSFASVEVHIDQRRIEGKWYAEDASLTGPSRIAIAYGQPHARGRKIEGGLIPLDTVWRFGANTSTTLHTDNDITVGGTSVPHGDYALYILYSRSGWQLILNRQTGGWGTEHDAKFDVARIALTAHTRTEREETLTIYLVPESARPSSGYADLKGTMRIIWGTTELSTGWTVPVK
ncbi:MAG: DUF2911 domain-containing protein [Gemmatimonadaceae bacterium]